MASLIPMGQPYELAGGPLPFTSWHYVHPSNVRWFEDAGENVSVHAAQRTPEPIIRSEQAWERGGSPITSALRKKSMYRLCAHTNWGTLDESMNRAGNRLCYCESDDGMTWRRRPNCNLFEYEDSKNNNTKNELRLFPNTRRCLQPERGLFWMSAYSRPA